MHGRRFGGGGRGLRIGGGRGGRLGDGKVGEFFGGVGLMEEALIKDPDQTVQQLVTEVIAKLGENIQVRRFSRFKVGEGVQKVAVDFSEEVRSQVAG